MEDNPFSVSIQPDWEALVRCIKRQGTPARVHHIELFLDPEVQDAVCERFDLADGLDTSDPYYAQKRLIALQRFLGYDYVRCGLENFVMPMRRMEIEDTASLQRESGRSFIEEQGSDFSAKMAGKLKMVFQCLSVIISLWLLATPEAETVWWLPVAAGVAAWVAVISTVYSGAVYVVSAARLLRG